MATETRIPSNAAFPTAESDLGPYHPRATGESFEAQHDDESLMDQASEHGRRLAAQASEYGGRARDMGQEYYEAGMDYYDEGSRQVRRWARRNPTQLWMAIGGLSLFALWMAYRPIFSKGQSRDFDASRYRYRQPIRRTPIRSPIRSGGMSSTEAAASTRPSDSPL